MNSEWSNMRDLGRLFGRTSHDVGRFLKHHEYRMSDGKPTKKSFDLGLVREHFANGYYSWRWHVERTSALLESLGWNKKHSSSQIKNGITNIALNISDHEITKVVFWFCDSLKY